MPNLAQLFEVAPAAGATTQNVFAGTVFETLTVAGFMRLRMVTDAPTTAGRRLTAQLQMISGGGSNNLIQGGSVIPVTRNGIAGSGPDISNSGLTLPPTRVAPGDKPVLTISNGDTAPLTGRIYIEIEQTGATGAV